MSLEFVSPKARLVVAEDFSACDPQFDAIMRVLREKRAAQCFHKHGGVLCLSSLLRCERGPSPFLNSDLRLPHFLPLWWHLGTFQEHLFNVWRILYLWEQSVPVCRTGFVHRCAFSV
jgi:hypothetical protein